MFQVRGVTADVYEWMDEEIGALGEDGHDLYIIEEGLRELGDAQLDKCSYEIIGNGFPTQNHAMTFLTEWFNIHDFSNYEEDRQRWLPATFDRDRLAMRFVQIVEA